MARKTKNVEKQALMRKQNQNLSSAYINDILCSDITQEQLETLLSSKYFNSRKRAEARVLLLDLRKNKKGKVPTCSVGQLLGQLLVSSTITALSSGNLRDGLNGLKTIYDYTAGKPGQKTPSQDDNRGSFFDALDDLDKGSGYSIDD